MFEKKYTNSQVTSLAVNNSHLYYATGSWLHVIDIETSVTKCSLQVFSYQRIHGIKIYSQKIIVFGFGKVCILDLDLVEVSRYECEDWILDAHLVGDKIFLVFAKNFIQCYEYNKFTLLSEKRPNIKCLLYCAKIVGEESDLSVALGTIYNQVIVWNLANDKEITLKGHTGFIFDIDYDKRRNLLLSASDDRTIILWDTLPGKIICRCFGHLARVWKCKIVNERLISASEDAECRIWNFEGECLSLFSGHLGKHIWSICSLDGSIVYTGGGDGSIRKWNESSSDSSIQIDCAGSFCFDNSDSLILIEESGYIRGGVKIPLANSFSMPKVLGNTLCVGDFEGNLHIVKEDQISSVKLFQGKIYAIFGISEDVLLVHAFSYPVLIYNIHNQSRIQVDFPIDDAVSAVLSLDKFLLIGTRKGTIHVYDKNFSLINTKKICDKYCVTDIKNSGTSIFVTSRNGIFYTFDLQLEKLAEHKITKGWLESIVVVSRKLLVAGFFQRRFFVYDLTANCQIFSVDCGGAHRKWHLNSAAKLQFAFQRQKKKIELEKSNMTIVKEPFHGRECRVVKSYKNLLITGGEDCLIKVWKENKQVLQLTQHSSVIRSIALQGSFMFSCGGNEELFAWKIETKKEVQCRLSCKFPIVSAIPSVRIMDIKTCAMSDNKGGGRIGILAIYSDSMFRFWVFQTDSQDCELYHESLVHREHCPLRISIPSQLFPLDLVDRFVAFTSGTDGRIVTINLSLAYKKRRTVDDFSWTPHQSGVNCILSKQITENEYEIYSGGDDGALVLSRIDIRLRLVTMIKTVSKHTAAVQDLQWLSDKQDLFISVSNDQKIICWSADLKVVSETFIDIYDPASIAVLHDPDSSIAVCGAGLEVLSLNIE